jgi:hypothetical protein
MLVGQDHERRRTRRLDFVVENFEGALSSAVFILLSETIEALRAFSAQFLQPLGPKCAIISAIIQIVQ